ncbi:MAG TPA: HEAT repeat domain-containing protein [Gemmataceae bacterium]|nr:HEAT repeat domain-containing protein [Gemmataceae bacterium]
MRLLSFAIVASVCFFAGVEAAAQTGKKPAPVQAVAGKKLDQWIDLIKSKDRAVSATALQVMLQFPPEDAVKAVPVILGELKKHNPQGPYLDASFRSLAPHTLAVIQTSLKKPDDKQIEQIKQTITQLTNMVKDGQIVIRKRAIAALVLFGPNAHDAIDALIAATSKADIPTCWETRHAAVTALGIIGVDMKNGPARKVLDALYARIDPRDPRTIDSASPVRLATIEALANVGATHRAELKAEFIDKTGKLIQKESDPHIELTARCHLYDATPPDTKDRKRRREIVAGFAAPTKELSLRLQAIRCVGKMGKDAEDTLLKISGYAFNDKEEMPVRVESLQCMGRMESNAVLHLPKVAGYAFNEKEEDALRIASFQFMGAMGEAARPYLPKLIGIVEGKENVDITGWAIWAVGAVAPDQQQWIAPLEKIKATKDEPEVLKKMAQEAIDNIKGKHKKDTKKGGAK